MDTDSGGKSYSDWSFRTRSSLAGKYDAYWLNSRVSDWVTFNTIPKSEVPISADTGAVRCAHACDQCDERLRSVRFSLVPNMGKNGFAHRTFGEPNTCGTERTV